MFYDLRFTILNVRTDHDGGRPDQMGLALVRIDLYGKLGRRGPRVRQGLGPSLRPESQKFFGDRRLFSPLKVGQRLQSLDVRPVKEKNITVLLDAIGSGGMMRIVSHGREF